MKKQFGKACEYAVAERNKRVQIVVCDTTESCHRRSLSKMKAVCSTVRSFRTERVHRRVPRDHYNGIEFAFGGQQQRRIYIGTFRMRSFISRMKTAPLRKPILYGYDPRLWKSKGVLHHLVQTIPAARPWYREDKDFKTFVQLENAFLPFKPQRRCSSHEK